MAMHELGPTIDLHGGGTDLIFPHHECEVAQSESITGQPFSRHWVHSAMVSYEGEKMSKSLGNLVFVSDLLKTADPRAIRLALMQHHYRAGFEWHDTDLDDGTALLHRLLAAAECPNGADPRPFAERVRAAIDDDLDAPRALEALDDLASAVLSGGDDPTAPETLRELGALLGIDLSRPRRSPAITRRVGPRPTGNVGGPCRSRSRCPTVRRATTSRGSPPARSRRRSAVGWPRPRWRRRSTADGGAAEWYDLSRPIEHDAAVAIVTPDSSDGREVLRHSTAHVMAQAVTDLFPGAKYAIGPAIEDGFYYDFELPDGAHFTDDDLGRIEARMREIVKDDEPFVREELDREHAIATFADQPYKIEIIERVDPADAAEIGDGTVISVYRNPRAPSGDEFVDLCRGPHVPSTKRLGAFKLTKVAGAYWRGDEKRPMLQRIYGTAWESKAALEEHLHRLEEAEKRDHRKLGAELDLFSFPDEIGSGLAVFHPKGGDRPPGDGGLLAPPARGGGLRVRQLTAHHQVEAVRDLGAPRLVRRLHVPADGARRRAVTTTSSR